ncbi:hypothetical protein GALMADRAFT_232322 [Galerina marginata CBS 339.88]|uniref:RING-type E3 ubiquitin transferase n=1 Tax=Galerina marginata (strain CBS 339.88) TaxID=685588 RepID=A0A067S7W0_GALM3|nr:hypothetical protein GALMADRAFT_232322 [Galerina marginata CBS 339.88]
MSPKSPRPPAKRIKLEDSTPDIADSQPVESAENDPDIADPGVTEEAVRAEDNENNCSICLHTIVDRTVIPKCSHDFCFECLLVWTEQSRRCPLCSQGIGEYLIHSIRSRYDYRKHYLPPLRTSPPPSRPAQSITLLQTTRQNARRRREREWGTRNNESEEFDKLERSIVKRRWIYQHDLYAKHVASNSFTKYRPYPTPTQFSSSQELISRTTTFLRRELQVWEGLDVEFLTSLILSLMKAIDIRSESAVKLISEFLDMDEPYAAGRRHVNAEHFAHEVYCYVRSPYRDLFVYDSIVQYDTPPGVTPPPDIARSRRWRPPSPPNAVVPSSPDHRRRPRSRSRSSERSGSWSPSGRQYLSSRNRARFQESEGSNRGEVENSYHRTKDILQNNGHQPRSKQSQENILLDKESLACEADSQIAESSKTPITSSSFTKNDRHMSIDTEDLSGKGKRKAYGMEITNTTPNPAGTTANVRQSETDLAPPGENNLRKRLQDDSGMQPISGRPLGSRVERAPRHKSLLDSVKAHLSGNAVPSSTTLAKGTMLQGSHYSMSSATRRI